MQIDAKVDEKFEKRVCFKFLENEVLTTLAQMKKI